ncbi:hypothetical protein NUACC26_068850 [Scytonema sp. NUACC26]
MWTAAIMLHSNLILNRIDGGQEAYTYGKSEV